MSRPPRTLAGRSCSAGFALSSSRDDGRWLGGGSGALVHRKNPREVVEELQLQRLQVQHLPVENVPPDPVEAHHDEVQTITAVLEEPVPAFTGLSRVSLAVVAALRWLHASVPLTELICEGVHVFDRGARARPGNLEPDGVHRGPKAGGELATRRVSKVYLLFASEEASDAGPPLEAPGVAKQHVVILAHIQTCVVEVEEERRLILAAAVDGCLALSFSTVVDGGLLRVFIEVGDVAGGIVAAIRLAANE